MKIVRVKTNGENKIIVIIEKWEEPLKDVLKNAWYLAYDEWEKIEDVLLDGTLKGFEIIEELEIH